VRTSASAGNVGILFDWLNAKRAALRAMTGA
jgi:hypothetical protein